jgi:hypothetical protein
VTGAKNALPPRETEGDSGQVTNMEFSEANNPWRSIPEWASFLIEFGFAWLGQPRDSRRIAVISMPSDSAAAGLVALGAMRKCLELDDANDTTSHYEKLLALAKSRPDGITLRHSKWKGEFAFDGLDRDGVPWVRQLRSRSNFRVNIPRSSALNWRIDGEPPVVLVPGQQVPNAQLYSGLVARGGEIRSSNLSESYSQVCLAGRGTGEVPTRGSMEAIRFREDGVEADLSQLLTVQSWMPGTISRVMFYNSRTEAFDRQSGKPQVVIADGDTSFLKVVDGTDFQDSDVVGVVHRTMERDRLEAIGTKLENLRQWYDHSAIEGLPQTPRGISISVLKRRYTCQ